MVNHQKRVQQETAYSEVVAIFIPVPISFLTVIETFKNGDGDTKL